MFRTLAICALMIPVSSFAADLNLDASSLKLKVYKFAVSTSPLCTDLVTVVDNGSTPQEVNFIGGVNLGSGSLADGTYPCVVIEMGTFIKYVPSANSTSTNCLISSEYTLDVCGNGDSSPLIDGSTTSCADDTDNRVAMYISTASTSTGGSDVFTPPTSIGDGARGLKLNSALTVAGAVTGKLVVNPDGKVCDDNAAGCDGGGGGTGTGGAGECKMEPPTFGFE